jgi:hypothetical protein
MLRSLLHIVLASLYVLLYTPYPLTCAYRLPICTTLRTPTRALCTGDSLPVLRRLRPATNPRCGTAVLPRGLQQIQALRGPKR